MHLITHVASLLFVWACFYIERNFAGGNPISQDGTGYLYVLVGLAYFPLIKNAYAANCLMTLVQDQGLAGTHDTINEIFYKNAPYLNPLFPAFAMGRHMTSSNARGRRIVPLGVLLSRRAFSATYLLGN